MNDQTRNIDPQTKILNLYSKKIQSLDIVNLINLNEVNCPNCLIQTFLISNENYDQLQKINLSNNGLQTIPPIKASNLKYLNFQKNFIKEIEQFSKQKYSKMRSLNLFSNSICILHQLLMTNLKFLYCQNNQIISIQQFAQGNYPGLISLNLSCNQLYSLPCLNTKNLKYFNCSKNQLVTIQQFSEGNYNEMQILDLSQNRIQKMFFINNPKLKYFDYQKNKVRIVYQRPLYETKATRYLKILKLEQQLIDNIQFIQPNYFNQLKQMHLNYNYITNFYPLNKCRLLKLQKLECGQNLNIIFDLSRAEISQNLKITKQSKLKSRFDKIKKSYLSKRAKIQYWGI